MLLRTICADRDADFELHLLSVCKACHQEDETVQILPVYVVEMRASE